MIDLHAALNGFALSAGLIVAIGAQNAFVLRQGLRREHVAPVVAFCAGADALLMAIGILGLGGLLQRLPGLTLLLTAGGAAFLAWYGCAALRRAVRPGALTVGREAPAASAAAVLGQAAGFTLLNPHVYLDTVLLVGAVGAAQSVGARPFFLIGAMLASVTWFATLGYGARLLAPVFAKPGAWRILDGLIGATMLALAAGLAGRTLEAMARG